MADPITIMDCIDAKTAENIVAFAPTPLHDCANAKSIFDFKKIGEDV